MLIPDNKHPLFIMEPLLSSLSPQWTLDFQGTTPIKKDFPPHLFPFVSAL